MNHAVLTGNQRNYNNTYNNNKVKFDEYTSIVNTETTRSNNITNDIQKVNDLYYLYVKWINYDDTMDPQNDDELKNLPNYNEIIGKTLAKYSVDIKYRPRRREINISNKNNLIQSKINPWFLDQLTKNNNNYYLSSESLGDIENKLINESFQDNYGSELIYYSIDNYINSKQTVLNNINNSLIQNQNLLEDYTEYDSNGVPQPKGLNDKNNADAAYENSQNSNISEKEMFNKIIREIKLMNELRKKLYDEYYKKPEYVFYYQINNTLIDNNIDPEEKVISKPGLNADVETIFTNSEAYLSTVTLNEIKLADYMGLTPLVNGGLVFVYDATLEIKYSDTYYFAFNVYTPFRDGYGGKVSCVLVIDGKSYHFLISERRSTAHSYAKNNNLYKNDGTPMYSMVSRTNGIHLDKNRIYKAQLYISYQRYRATQYGYTGLSLNWTSNTHNGNTSLNSDHYGFYKTNINGISGWDDRWVSNDFFNVILKRAAYTYQDMNKWQNDSGVARYNAYTIAREGPEIYFTNGVGTRYIKYNLESRAAYSNTFNNNETRITGFEGYIGQNISNIGSGIIHIYICSNIDKQRTDYIGEVFGIKIEKWNDKHRIYLLNNNQEIKIGYDKLLTSATYFKLEYTNGISTVTIDNKDYTISNGPLSVYDNQSELYCIKILCSNLNTGEYLRYIRPVYDSNYYSVNPFVRRLYYNFGSKVETNDDGSKIIVGTPHADKYIYNGTTQFINECGSINIYNKNNQIYEEEEKNDIFYAPPSGSAGLSWILGGWDATFVNERHLANSPYVSHHSGNVKFYVTNPNGIIIKWKSSLNVSSIKMRYTSTPGDSDWVSGVGSSKNWQEITLGYNHYFGWQSGSGIQHEVYIIPNNISNVLSIVEKSNGRMGEEINVFKDENNNNRLVVTNNDKVTSNVDIMLYNLSNLTNQPIKFSSTNHIIDNYDWIINNPNDSNIYNIINTKYISNKEYEKNIKINVCENFSNKLLLVISEKKSSARLLQFNNDEITILHTFINDFKEGKISENGNKIVLSNCDKKIDISPDNNTGYVYIYNYDNDTKNVTLEQKIYGAENDKFGFSISVNENGEKIFVKNKSKSIDDEDFGVYNYNEPSEYNDLKLTYYIRNSDRKVLWTNPMQNSNNPDMDMYLQKRNTNDIVNISNMFDSRTQISNNTMSYSGMYSAVQSIIFSLIILLIVKKNFLYKI